ncbi:MAG: hypothetical protein IPM50_02585 [Acidobacteriota bacterium]|nr:MAG: hypothetical protein IPM50_02585 [Acidobacteriota bacterium]
MAEEFINGYHVLGICNGRDPIEDIRFEEYQNSLGAGAYARVLVGRNTGEKTWRLSWPFLAGASAQASVHYRGAVLTPADYLWALYCDERNGASPFVIRSPRNGQNYFARFAQSNLTFQRLKTLLFSTGVELRQCYVDGVTVYDPEKLNGIYGRYIASQALPISYTWPSAIGSNDLAIQGEPAQVPNVQNGKTVLRLNEDALLDIPPPPDYVNRPSTTITVNDILIVMKVREDLFTGYQGILSASVDHAHLVGDPGTAKFVNLSLGNGFEYRINGVTRPQNDQAAPMNRFGVVHIHFDTGLPIQNLQFGVQQDIIDRKALVDLGEIWIFNGANPMNDLLELTQHLITDWDL